MKSNGPVVLSFPFVIPVIILLAACTSMRPVAANKLEEKLMIGFWRADPYWIRISCSGAISYHKPYYTESLAMGLVSATVDANDRTESSSGSHIAQLEANRIVAGSLIPVTKETLHVIEWPQRDNQGLTMNIEGTMYRLDRVSDPCPR